MKKIFEIINDGMEGKLSPSKAFWLYYWVWGTIIVLLIQSIINFFFPGSKWQYFFMFLVYSKITEDTWKCSKNFKNLKKNDWRQILFKTFLAVMMIIYFIGLGVYMEWWGQDRIANW